MTAILVSSYQLEIKYFQQVPDRLRAVIQQVSKGHYRELYEENSTPTLSLKEALRNVLKMLDECSQNPRFSYFCLAMILGLAVRPTVRCYLPNESFTRLFFQELFHSFFEQKKIEDFKEHYEPFLGKYQALDEAILVLKEMLQVSDPLQAPSKLLDMSEICLEGYAIFPGSAERRKLFDWWLLEAIPAAYLQIFPSHIYTIKGLGHRQESLKRLQSYFWAVVRQEREKKLNDSGSLENLLSFMAG
jgi:hypothetical protein